MGVMSIRTQKKNNFKVTNFMKCLCKGWAKSHFTLLKANKTQPNKTKISAVYQKKDDNLKFH